MLSGEHRANGKLRWQLLIACSPFIGLTLLVVLACEALDALSGLHSHVQREAMLAGAQKSAIRHLQDYARTSDSAEFESYEREIAVANGDRLAQRELQKSEPELSVVRQGFLAGRNDPADIPGLIRLYQRFHATSFARTATSIWNESDRQTDTIMTEAENLQKTFGAGADQALAPAARIVSLQNLHSLDTDVTRREHAFSTMLGEISQRVGERFKFWIVALASVLALLKAFFSWWMLRRQAEIESALRASEEQFDLAVRGSNDGIWNWNSPDETLYLSQRAVQLLGYPFHDLPRGPRELLLLVHEQDRKPLESAVAGMLGHGEALDIEVRFLDWGGNYRWVQLRGRAVGMEQQQRRRAAGSITDIGDRKRAEERARELALDEQHQSEQEQIALVEQVQGRIGRELHDDLGQRLAGVGFLVKAMEQRLTTNTPVEGEQARWIVALINESIDRVRFLSRQLSPIELDEISLAAALRRLIDDVQGIFGTRIALRISDVAMQVSGADSNQFFRITQESISNALRHGHATEITVCLDVFARSRRLAIFDNGRGFQVRDSQSLGLGLRNMEIRARSLRGRLRVRSTQRGTAVIVRSDLSPALQLETP